jgi:hypothetical protein
LAAGAAERGGGEAEEARGIAEGSGGNADVSGSGGGLVGEVEAETGRAHCDPAAPDPWLASPERRSTDLHTYTQCKP